MSYSEARRLIVPQKTQTYAQAAKTSTTSTATQIYEKITQIICPPLKLLQTVPKTSYSNLADSTSSTQINLLMSTSSTAATMSETQTPIPMSIAIHSSTKNMFTPIISSPSITSNSLCSSASQSLVNKKQPFFFINQFQIRYLIHLCICYLSRFQIKF
ncbi:hypothetical protein TNCV_3173621 [Trichonephila clavipes]|nr:hypothetical protein TNCV_3173621 [Trichonephila clavipes]